jgi:HAE1 family hydrophobic/amphiphilic exporter-1
VGLVDFAIRRRVTIAMATVAIILLGMISLSRLKVNLLPDLSYPTLTIRTELPGAAPTEIENLISRPVEEAAGVVRNVRSVRSVSRSGQSDVIIEFTWGTDMDFAGIEVRERLDLLWLPVEATRPLLLRFDPSSEPVMRVAFVDESARAAASQEDRLKFLRRFADDRIKPEIESVEGSAAVKVSGGFEDEVQIYVDQQRLAQLKLSIEQVARRIGAENVNLSGGRLEQGTQRFLVRTVNEFDTLDDMANSVIANVDAQPVYLKDVARVERGYKDRTAITRLNGDECIELAIYKEGDANTVQMAQGIRAKLEALEKTLPAGTKLVPVYDQSKFIASAVSDVKDAAILGGLLSILVLYFFLRDAWATIVTGIVIPVTVVGIFVMMYTFDLTLNVMSLGGIALSVGMLIDNSVVILEAIARRKEAGLSTIDAAREGTAEVATAVTASTLTSVAVFFPMVFVSGIAGQLFRDQALTVTFAQLISLMVGLTLVPMLTAWRARLGDKEAELAPDAGEPRETLGALRQYLRALKANFNVSEIVRPRDPVATTASRVPAFFRSIGAAIRWVSRFTGWLLRYVFTFLVRVLRIVLGFLGKLFALLLSPFVWVTQKSYSGLDRRYPAVLQLAGLNPLPGLMLDRGTDAL